jgi:hypothetical protein
VIVNAVVATVPSPLVRNGSIKQIRRYKLCLIAYLPRRHKVRTTVSRTLVKKVEKEETIPLFSVDGDRPLVALTLARSGFLR